MDGTLESIKEDHIAIVFRKEGDVYAVQFETKGKSEKEIRSMMVDLSDEAMRKMFMV